jgi:regulator of sigma E protease
LKNGIMITDTLGYQLGFMDGDKIVSVDDQPVYYYDELVPKILSAKSVVIERQGERKTLLLPVNFIEQLIDNKGKNIFTVPFYPVVGKVQENSTAEKVGIEINDRFLAVNGKSTLFFSDLKNALKESAGQDANFTVLRGKDTLQIVAQISHEGTLGFYPLAGALDKEQGGLYTMETRTYGFFEAFPAGVGLAMEKLNYYVDQFKLMLNPQTGAYKGLGGFGTLTKIYSPQWDWQHFWSVTAFLSLVLAFMNLLPIPGLDGGYVMFILYEMLTGRKVNEKVMEVATTIGLVLLLVLMFYANGMDIVRGLTD